MDFKGLHALANYFYIRGTYVVRTLFLVLFFCWSFTLKAQKTEYKFSKNKQESLMITNEMGKHLLALPDHLLDKELLVISGLNGEKFVPRPVQGIFFEERVIRFRLGKGNCVYLERIFHKKRSLDTSVNGMNANVQSSILPAVLATWPISEKGTSGVIKIDVTDFLRSKENVFDLTKLTQPIAILLPETPIPIYRSDPRVGIDEIRFLDFDRPVYAKNSSIITRFRLTPKPEDEKRYLAGELVAPADPIVFMLDKQFPENWRRYFDNAILGWQEAFKKAGFIEAIQVLHYKEGVNKQGTSKHKVIINVDSVALASRTVCFTDPRTGEIVYAKIDCSFTEWNTLVDRYMVQMGKLQSRSDVDTHELEGLLIQREISRLVGKALGLKENLRASATVSLKKLMSPKHLAKYGMVSSIMDSVLCNYVISPTKQIKSENTIPQIGIYDHWAIEWGYRWLPAYENRDLHRYQWVNKKLSTSDRLLYSTVEDGKYVDAYSLAGDLSDNVVKAAYYGMENLYRSAYYIARLQSVNNADSVKSAFLTTLLREHYKTLLFSVVATLRGGAQETAVNAPIASIRTYVAKKQKKDAVRFLRQHLFASNTMAEIFDRSTMQKMILAQLMSPATFTLLSQSNIVSPKIQQYTWHELLIDLKASIPEDENILIDLFAENLMSLTREKGPRFHLLRTVSEEQLKLLK